jgi:SAM-dependent methyltransferase
VFGFNALQIGLPSLDLLSANRIPLRIKIDTVGDVDLCCHLTELPLASQSIDLVVLPFVLDFDADPHQVLREIERVLRPEGQLLIIGFNPWSLWGFWRWVNRLPYPLVQRPRSFPWNGKYLSIARLRDWLQLLSFEVDRGAFGCYVPPCGSAKMLGRLSFLERAGDRWWRGAGGTYLLRAVKRVKGMRLMPPWATVTPSSGQRVLKPSLTGATGVRQEGKSE